MRICGLQKLTLLDYPGKIAATVFLGGCNFRCPFCHNASLVLSPGDAPEITREELLTFLETRRGLLDGVCVTGGEPLMSDGATALIRDIKALGFCVKLDTNGSFPERLGELLSEGLVDYVAMDIKNSPEKYTLTAGLESLDIEKIKKSAALIMASGAEYEFRTTLVRELHERRDLITVGEWLTGAEKYFLQHFEDSGDLIGSGLSGCSKEESEAFARALTPYFGSVATRGL